VTHALHPSSVPARTTPSSADDRQVSWAVGTAIVLITTAVAVTVAPALRHWFIVPVTMCGILVIPDAVHWARRRLDTFDPQAMLGLLGTHFFYVAPLLHVLLDYWAKYIDGSDDWRHALGQMAVLNVLGLLLYRAVMAPRIEVSTAPLPGTDFRRLSGLAAAFVVVGALGFALLVQSMGGLAAYVAAMADERQQLAGLGPALLAAKIFPTAALVLVLVRFRGSLRERPAILFWILPAYVLAELLIAGLGGSRSHTVWSLVIGVGLCHMIIKPVRRRALAVLTLVLVAFMYFYGFYKDYGTKAIESFREGVTLDELSTETGRDLPGVLLADLGRADVQALVLERHREGVAPLRYGTTYAGDLTFLVPDTVGLTQVPDKVLAGTELIYGQGTYGPDFKATLVYGLAGEAILNFGSPGAVLSFLPFALVMRRVSAFYRRCLAVPDSIGLKLLAPSLSLGATLILSSDWDNLGWFFLNYVAVLAVLALASRTLPSPSAPPPVVDH
jgi:hypothetical protein